MAKPHHPHRSARLIKKRGRKLGAAPGTLVHVGEVSGIDARIDLIYYDASHLEEHSALDISQCRHEANVGQTAWYNITGLHNAEIIRSIGNLFQLHPLVQEDILNTDHRPKIEVHDTYLYVVLKMLQFDQTHKTVQMEQVSLIVGDDYVLSFQERAGDVFDGVRERLRHGHGRRIRELGPDYLTYALVDAVVDNYFVLLENLGDAIEDLEADLLSHPTPDTLNQIHHYKREMLLLRKAVWPLREILSSLSRDESVILSQDIRVYLRDVYDHTIHIIDNIETLRDLLGGMLDLYMSSVSQRMNEIMKVLTLFASIFMPLTFIAGVYGMNFDYMPELRWHWGYPVIMAFMLATGAALFAYFRWRKWW